MKDKFLQLWFRVMSKIRAMKKEEVVIESKTIKPESNKDE